MFKWMLSLRVRTCLVRVFCWTRSICQVVSLDNSLIYWMNLNVIRSTDYIIFKGHKEFYSTSELERRRSEAFIIIFDFSKMQPQQIALSNSPQRGNTKKVFSTLHLLAFSPPSLSLSLFEISYIFLFNESLFFPHSTFFFYCSLRFVFFL